MDALIDAAEAGKQVLVLVEIKARFDEHANISWARKLEQAGCHVVYGLIGLKTHCKLSLVVRREGGFLRRYSHVGTGNYNPKTARLYEDLGLLTCDNEIGADLSDLFNRLSGFAHPTKFGRLLTAPNALRPGLIELIGQQRELAEAGKPSRVRIKVNSIVDEALIDALYEASQAGVPVEVWVRGICALRPGVEGMSENIRVRSVLGRFLEHSRAFVFGTDEAGPGVDRQRGPDAPEPGPPGGGPGAAGGTGAAAGHLGAVRPGDGPQDPAWDLAGDGTWTRIAYAEDGSPLADLQNTLIAERADWWSRRTG